METSVKLIVYGSRVSSICSLIGSGFVCFLFFYFKWWTYSTHHVILFCISFADIFYSLAIFLAPWILGSSTWCTIYWCTVVIFGIASLIWCFFLGLNLYLQMRYYWTDRKCRALMPWYCAFAYGLPIICATIHATRENMEQYEAGCKLNDEEVLVWAFAHYLPIWIIFLCNCFIVTKIVLLLRRVIATIPEDIDNARKVKRHYKFITFQTLMYVFGGLLCYALYLFVPFWNDSYWVLVLHCWLNPLQGFVNLLVYVGLPNLKCCCNKCNGEERISAPDNTLASMDQDVKAVEVMMTKTNEQNIDFDEDENFTTYRSPLSTYKMSSPRMSFFEGPGIHAIDIVRRSLAEHNLQDKTVQTAGEGRLVPFVSIASSEASNSSDEGFQEEYKSTE